jgi:hypothetical protein
MKKGWFVLALLLTAGCLHPGSVADPRKAPPTVVAPAPGPPPVTEDGITEQNAAERARALRQELEREAIHQSGPSAAAADNDPRPAGK